MTSDPTPMPPADNARLRLVAIALILSFVAPLALGIETLGWGPIGGQNTLAASIDMKDRAAHRAGSPKVILVGGSNLAFGIVPPVLEARLGRPVINVALHAALGIDLIAERAAQYVGPGDVVVLSPEWSHFTDRKLADDTDPVRLEYLRVHGSEINRPSHEWIGSRYRFARGRASGMIDQVSSRWIVSVNSVLRRGGDPSVPGVYGNFAALDDDGNIRPGLRPAPRRPESIAFTSPAVIAAHWTPDRSRVADALDVLAAACTRAGATLYVMPSIRVRPPSDDVDFAPLEARWLAFAADRVGAKALFGPGQTEFPTSLAYDTMYHLNDEGAAIMTDRLLAPLRTAINAAPSTRPHD